MDHPAVLGAQQQSSGFRSAAVAPTVVSNGNQRRLGAFARKPIQTGGFSPFSRGNVRQEAYAGPKISAAPPQRLHQLLQAYLAHHGLQ